MFTIYFGQPTRFTDGFCPITGKSILLHHIIIHFDLIFAQISCAKDLSFRIQGIAVCYSRSGWVIPITEDAILTLDQLSCWLVSVYQPAQGWWNLAVDHLQPKRSREHPGSCFASNCKWGRKCLSMILVWKSLNVFVILRRTRRERKHSVFMLWNNLLRSNGEFRQHSSASSYSESKVKCMASNFWTTSLTVVSTSGG